MQPFHLTKELWTWQELMGAVKEIERTNVGCVRVCSGTCPPTLEPKFYIYTNTVFYFHMAISLRAGDCLE